MIQGESPDVAKEGAELPGSKVGKFRFAGTPGFGEIGSQGGRDATENGNGRPNLTIRVSAS